MANQNKRKQVKLNATRVLCLILAGLMVVGSIAVIVSAIASSCGA